MKLWATCCVALLVTPLYSWAQYRCIENGKTVFTDRPCTTEPATPSQGGISSKVIGDQVNSAYSSPYGEWRGQVQYQTTYHGQPITDAHAVVATTVLIDPQGKVSGASPENGCRMKGIASPGISRALLNLDVTLSGCHYSRFNRRLSGTLALHPAEKQAQFWIYAMPVDLLSPGWSYDIKGTVRR